MQYTWYVPQDVQGYINEAGKELFRKRLDELFTVELPDDIPGAHDIQGRIGAYWHGNEPCHHVAYLYNYLKDRGNVRSGYVPLSIVSTEIHRMH